MDARSEHTVIIPIKAFSGNSRNGYSAFRVYNTKEYICWTEFVKARLPNVKFTSECCLDVEFGYSDKRRRDLDNALKCVLDACNGVIFNDDRQVCVINAKKVRSESDYIKLTIKEFIDKTV